MLLLEDEKVTCMIHFLENFDVQSCISLVLIKCKLRGGGVFALFNDLVISYCKSFRLIPNLQHFILKYSKIIYFSSNYKIRYLFRMRMIFFDSSYFFMKQVWMPEWHKCFRAFLWFPGKDLSVYI